MTQDVQENFKRSFEQAVPEILSMCSDYDRLGTLERINRSPSGLRTWMLRGRSRWGLDACLERGYVQINGGKFFLTSPGYAEFTRLDSTIGEFGRSIEREEGTHPIRLSDFGFWDGVHALALLCLLFVPFSYRGVISCSYLISMGLCAMAVVRLKKSHCDHRRLDSLRFITSLIVFLALLFRVN